jgi:formate--tetrahydrofolate ligase
VRPILAVAEELGIASEHVIPYGRSQAKIDLAALQGPARGKGRVVLVSAISPTPAGEGKTTVSIGLAMGMRAIGRRVALALREPSLGPVFGLKGGATGGGKAQLVPAQQINLHFTGDLHAITAAHNLLAALVDNDLHFGAKSGLEARRTTWGRAIDMNDRALRNVVVGLGGTAGGVPRETRFDITAASEVMAIFCLASSQADLRERLARIVVGRTATGVPVTAGQLGAADAMAVLLQDALHPNLVQTREGGPAFVHGGPFANIAHGCSSLVGTRMGMQYADDVITEGGFGFDLGAEKFLDIKCRAGGIFPRCVVLVATLRALKLHGGAKLADVQQPDRGALERGLDHLDKHLETVAAFGLTPVVALNVFSGSDTEAELKLVEAALHERGVRVARSEGFARGGEGAIELARVVGGLLDETDAAPPPPQFLYPIESTYVEKIRAVARTAYGADDVEVLPAAAKELARFPAGLPVCIAKTHLSLSDDATRQGRPRGFSVTVREARLAAGAGFVVALLGEVLTMPGLPKEPAALKVRIDPDGVIRGLMQGE